VAKISLVNVAHSYDQDNSNNFAVNPVDQMWDDGGAYALLGPSGCGKTTLLNIISGLLKPSQGQILFDGEDVTRQSPEQRNIAQVFQFPVVYDTMTVADNLAFPLRNRGLDKAEIDRRVSDIIEMLELQKLANRKASGLNADAKQKISLGRGLVREDVRAILFDEPLTVIDPALKWQLRTELKRIHRRLQRTMIYVTHDQTEALTFADKVAVMNEGSVLQLGTPEELFNLPQHTFVGKFIGSPGLNVLPCRITQGNLTVANNPLQLNRQLPNVEGNLELGIRPEFIALSSTEGLEVDITAVEDLGRYRIIRTLLGGHTVNLVQQDTTAIPDHPRLEFDPEKVLFYKESQLLQAQEIAN